MEQIAHIGPAQDQIEVSVFGPGYGESIVIHVGNNDWIIVDSCIDPASGKPAPLEYLERIGVNPATDVRLIVATHWHDDHIRGFGRVFRICSQSEFSCSDALQSKQFLSLVQAFGTRPMMVSSGADEFFDVLSVMEERARRAEPPVSGIHPKWAIADRALWHRDYSSETTPSVSRVYALSPSDAAKSRSLDEIANLLPAKYSPKRRVLAQSPNNFAVVLWVNARGTVLLLGADLENPDDVNMGWDAILRSRTRPVGRACFFKVPHHGSSGADHPGVWSQMLDPNPLCVITPFRRGSTRLPQRSDVERIVRHTDEAYITADLIKLKKLKRPKPVEELLRGAVRSIRTVHSSFGHVRIRTGAGNDRQRLNVELFGDAIPLSAFQGN